MTRRTAANAEKKRQLEQQQQQENEEKDLIPTKKPRKERTRVLSNGPIGESKLTSQSYPTGKLPLIINYHNFQVENIPLDWGLPAHATLAAQNLESYARLMGHVDLQFKDVDASTLNKLVKNVSSVIQYRGNCYCNDDGEYPTPSGQIPLSRLLDLLKAKELKAVSSLTKELLNGLWALQTPHTSPWNLPFIRVYSTHTHQIQSGQTLLTISYHLYFSRLIFELISDPTIKFITEHLKDAPCKIVRCQNPYVNKKIAEYSKPDAEMLQIPEYRFSLQGLLKYVENTGYQSVNYVQPENLLVNLYDYQKSTCQWMLDHELDEFGLNSQFWEEWQFPSGNKNDKGTSNYLYYFPIGGEYRFTKPPVARGGLLCEEMGLGKTVEILALILSNPSIHRPRSFPSILDSPIPPATDVNLIPCHTSLIIVPNHLLPQWWNEITRRVKCGTNYELGELTAINLFQRGRKDAESIPTCDIRGLKVVIDEAGNQIYEREEWGHFDHTRGNLVEIRNLPFATPNIILRGIIASYSTFYRKRADDTSSTPTIYPCIEVHLELTHENFYSPLSDIHKFDIVLTSYSEIRESRGSQNLYMSHQWHRIILDECQEIKNTTNQVATMCANLESERRWMVSGTPLCSKVEDLHGELNFLKIWPFCLDNSKDGFWDLRIGKPFLRKDESSLQLLYALLDVVMMRHTKNQRSVHTNEPLIKMPSRTIEWRGVDLTGDDRFIYEYLESFAADAYEQFLERQGDREDSQIWSKSQSGQLRSLYSLLSRCCTHTSAISLQNLDHLKRMLVKITYGSAAAAVFPNADDVTIPLLSAEEVLNRVQSLGSGVAGGLNYQSNRVQASVTAHEADEKMRTALLERSVQSLNDEVVGLGLPQPISWNTLPYTASIDHQSTSLILYPLLKDKKAKKSAKVTKDSTVPDNDGDEDETAKQSLALHTHFLRGDVGRLGRTDKDEAEFVVSRVLDKKSNPHELAPMQFAPPTNETKSNTRRKKSSPVLEDEVIESKSGAESEVLGEIQIESRWALEPHIRTPIFKKDVSKRKQPFVELLVAHAHSLNTGDKKSKGAVQIHEGGFSTIYKLMAGQAVSCPLCLVEACRPTITTCVHVYCHDCIMDVVKREINCVAYGPKEAKCPVCRRGINYSSLMEVKIDNVEEIPEDLPLKKIDSGLAVIPEVEETEPAVAKLTEPPVESKSNIEKPKRASSRKKIVNDDSMERVDRPSVKSTSADDISFIIPTFQQSGVATLSTEVDEKFGKHSHGGMYRDPSLPSIAPTALPIFRRAATFVTPKIKAILDDMENVKKDDLFAKFVIFSQYKESIVALQAILKSKNVECAALLSSTSLDNQGSLRTFYQDPNCNVLLLTTGVAATGLTLTIAHILYMLEPCSNAAEEAQAVSRIHRIGQTKCVKCVIFYAKDTCEDRLLHLREKNKLLSEVLANERSNPLLAMSSEIEIEEENSRKSMKALKSKLRQRAHEQKEQQTGGVFFVGKNLAFLFGTDEDRADRRKIAELEEQNNVRRTAPSNSWNWGYGTSSTPAYTSSSHPPSSSSNSNSNGFSLFPRTGVVSAAYSAVTSFSSFFSPTSSSSSSNPSCSSMASCSTNPSCGFSKTSSSVSGSSCQTNGSRFNVPIVLDSDDDDDDLD